MAAAYAAIANNGIYCSPIAIDRVVIRKGGEELQVPQTACSQAVAPEIAAAMSHALRAVMTGGTGSAANPNDGTPLAGKTGTTDSRVHTWMTGYSSKVATATWVGNITGLTTQSNKSVNGRQVSTIRHAVWRSIMTEVNSKYGGDPFPQADERFISSTMLTVPSITGFEVESAKTALISSGLNVSVIKSQVPSSAPAGTIAYTLPAAGTSAVKGTIVKVYVSRGGQVVVPRVAGMSIESATIALQELGFTVTLPQRSQTALLSKCDATLPAGSAFGTLPEAGAPATPSSAIVLIPNSCG
jgi:membrane peptidoglycan carboxypeptidase